MKEHLPKIESLMGVAELNSLARDCALLGSYAEARRYLELSLQQEKTGEAYRTLGSICARNKDFEKAHDFFDEALSIDENDAETVAAIGDAYAFSNEPIKAMGYYMLAIQMAPDVLKYKESFIFITKSTALYEYNDAVEKIVLECLKSPGLNCTGMAGFWCTALVLKPFFLDILTPVDHGGLVGFDKNKFEALGDFRPFMEPYFLMGIKALVVKLPLFEEFMTSLRRALLDELDPLVAKRMSLDQHFTLAEAMAHYCFFTEYIFDCTEAEKIKVNTLRTRLEDASDPAAEKNNLAVYACYAPLYGLKNHEEFSAALRQEPLMADVIKSQIDDYSELQARALTMQAITPIDNAVSDRVKKQYEEFPYPRWKNPPGSTHEEKFVRYLTRKEELQILVAGCGTGQEPVQLARLLPHAQILAVDLSRASLAYGESKARHLNLNNIVFRQADILHLDSLERRFDFISCGGVLHHMEDPLRGWRILVDLLKPGGMMRIGLYSEMARKEVVAAINVIRDRKYSPDAEGIRRFRKAAPQILPADTFSSISLSPDYYQMSTCRDLLFHVQEKRFDIPKIRAALDQLGLVFMQMSSHYASPIYRSEQPDDPDGTKLDQWEAFETRHPKAFGGMYQFWCQKKIN